MKILFLNITSVVGGAERSLLDMLASLRQCDASQELHLLVPQPGPLVDKARMLGTTTHILPLPARLLGLGDSTLRGRGPMALLGALSLRVLPMALDACESARRLRGFVRRLRPDIIDSNSLKFHLLSALARTEVPVVWHLQDFIGSRPLMARVVRLASPACSGAIAISHAVAEDAQRVLPGRPITTIHHAADTQHYRPGDADPTRLDSLANLPHWPQAVRIGLVATYARWKGHAIFLDAAIRLVERFPAMPLRFYIVGGPIYATKGSQWTIEELRARSARLSQTGQIGFVPFQPDPAEVYRSLDVVVHASTQPEPFGLAIVEAMACGRAVVAAQAGGAAEIFTPGRDALGHVPGNADSLADALAMLVTNPHLRQNLGEEARRTVVARFARERLGPQLLAAYRRFNPRTYVAPLV